MSLTEQYCTCLVMSTYVPKQIYTATNKPAQPMEKFEIRTVEGLAQYLACTKGFRNVFPKGLAG